MKKIRRALLLLTLVFACSALTNAQSLLQTRDLSATQIDSYSDDEMRALQQKIVEMGISETQLYKLAEERGLAAGEVVKLRKRMEALAITRSAINVKAKEDAKETPSTELTNSMLPMQSFDNDNSIFGSELFTKNSLVFEPNLRISTPAGYILGPDDEIKLQVYGTSEKAYDLLVNAEGYIYILNAGPVYVSGLSIEQATERIKAKLSATIYKALRSGQTKLQLSLSKIRSIRVTVIGEAKKPGTFTVSSLTTLYNILYLCGGPTKMGSYRAIELVRGNEVKRSADLYAFLLKGNQKDNLLLQEGDVIRIPYYKNRVSIQGQVKRTGKFELLAEETFKELLDYCGGFTDEAYSASVSVNRITDKEKKIVDLTADRYASFKASGSDEYYVGRLLDHYENRIVLQGAVNRPGPYELSAGLSLKTLVEKAGGVNPDAFTSRISIFRFLPNKLPIIVSVSLDSVLNFNKDVSLVRDDSIYVHSIFDYKDQAFVSIEGAVRVSGRVSWRENLTLRDVLLSNGSFSESGVSTAVEISRRIKNATVTQADYLQTEVFTVNVLNKEDASADVKLQPFDIIVVKGMPGYSMQRMVLVQGEVLNPGRYSLQKSGDKLTDLLRRTGGFKSTADSLAITIRRAIQPGLSMTEREKIFQRILNVSQDSIERNEKLRSEIFKNYDLIGVNLTKALENPASTENLLLEEGDIISIDRSSNLVKVSGEVYYPTVIPYRKNTNLKYYINKAGDFTDFARKSGAMVVYPDGSAKSVKQFLFFKTYPKVTPRSEIFVPQKLASNRNKLGASEWAVIVSTLGVVASLIKLIFP
ncbi:MAG: SLBB domain-containing protein [Chitinophagaceae bacterium]